MGDPRASEVVLTGAPFSPAGPGGPWGPGLPGMPMGPAAPAGPLSPGDPWGGARKWFIQRLSGGMDRTSYGTPHLCPCPSLQSLLWLPRPWRARMVGPGTRGSVLWPSQLFPSCNYRCTFAPSMSEIHSPQAFPGTVFSSWGWGDWAYFLGSTQRPLLPGMLSCKRLHQRERLCLNPHMPHSFPLTQVASDSVRGRGPLSKPAWGLGQLLGPRIHTVVGSQISPFERQGRKSTCYISMKRQPRMGWGQRGYSAGTCLGVDTTSRGPNCPRVQLRVWER